MKKKLSESLAISILSKQGVEIRGRVIIAKEGVKGLSGCSAMDYLHNYHNFILRVGK